jgi:putative lipoic acid-binding regulatory protein
VDNRPSRELLESTHPFPGTYQIRAIGLAADDFPGRVVSAVSGELAGPSELDYSVRTTRGGRHVAVTLDVTVQSADQVRAIYAQIQDIAGLTLLF